MRRRLFTLFSTVSLLLCVAVCVLWVRSYWAWDCWAMNEYQPVNLASSYSSIEAWRGRVSVSYIPSPRSFHSLRQNTFFEAGGFGFERTFVGLRQMSTRHAPEPPWDFNGPASDGFVLRFPYWFPALCTVVLPAVRLKSALARDHADGLCPTCGYDMRATPERCPECGAVRA